MNMNIVKKWWFILPSTVIVLIALSNLSGPEDWSEINQRDAQEVGYWSTKEYEGYIPSNVEKYILDHLVELGYISENNPKGCTIWKDPSATNLDIHKSIHSYSTDLDNYIDTIKKFQPVTLELIDEETHTACDALKLHPDGMSAMFPSGQLSLSSSGWVEPLYPPLRSHKFCYEERHVMSLDYLVHDFEAMCHKLKPTSKKIFVDMGASLSFHASQQPPALELLNLYEKFGFHFDHIYAFEITFTEPKSVFEQLLPEKYFASYHWINTGVSHIRGHKMNPLHSILEKFSEDDFIVVKLDIDTSSIEVPLVEQLLEGGPDGMYHKLIDQFYFEHHVHLGELAQAWGRSMNGSLAQSLDIFSSLRNKGIPAHYWP